MLNALDISTSALVAQRLRMNAISNNLANMSTTHNENGKAEPYQAKFVVFETDPNVKGPAGTAGVRVRSVETANVEPRYKYQPGHPDAIPSGPHAGYVAYPNINMMAEFTDAIETSRSYEANVGAIEISKDLIQHTLRILA